MKVNDIRQNFSITAGEIKQYLIAKAEGYNELVWFHFAGGLRYCKKRAHFNNVRRWIDLEQAILFCKHLNEISSGYVVVSTTDYTNLKVEYSENLNNSQIKTTEMTDFTVRFTSVGGNALEINSQSGGVAMIEEWEKQTRSYFSGEGYNGIQVRGLSEDLTIKVGFQQAQNVPAFENAAAVSVSVTVGALNDYTFPVATSDKMQLMPDKKAIFDAWVSAGSPLLWNGKPGN